MMVKRNKRQMFKKHLMFNMIKVIRNQNLELYFSRYQTFGLDCLNIETGIAG